MRPPTPEEVSTLLAHAAAVDALLGMYLALAAITGARRGQLLALRWGHVDLEGGCLRIQRSIVEGPDGPVLVPTKTRRSYRLSLGAGMLELLRSHYASLEPVGQRADSFLFSSEVDYQRPWLPNFVTKRFVDVRRGAGLAHFRSHDLRHFMATEMLDAGVPLPIVAARLAHARASTTLNVYAHVVPGGDQVAADTLRLRLHGAAEKPDHPEGSVSHSWDPQDG
jgi:integrase